MKNDNTRGIILCLAAFVLLLALIGYFRKHWNDGVTLPPEAPSKYGPR